MPIAKFISKEQIEHKRQLLLELEEKCSACDDLKGLTPDKEYLYTVWTRGKSNLSMLAVSQYDSCHTYAIYMPDELIEEHILVFDHFLSEIQEYAGENEQIIVFSQKSYDTINKYNYGGKKLNVKLYV